MKRWIHLFASMKIAIGLIVFIAFAMACGTILESMKGSAVAGRLVYGAAWFKLSLALFALNLLCALIDGWPWGRGRIGFALTHASMIVILAGAAVTDVLKVEGRLTLWEGEESTRFIGEEPAGGGAPPSWTLPFKVRLEDFQIDYYQGTDRPAMYRSRVVVTDARTGRSFPAVIQMNHELSFRGYRLFQSSYQQQDGREATVLAVSKDPGLPIVFLGYGLLIAGMLTVLGTRIAQRRAAIALTSSAHFAQIARAAAFSGALLLCAGSGLGAAMAQSPHGNAGGGPLGLQITPASLEELKRLPVQHDGRVMPLDTLAREAVWQVSGRPFWGGRDAVEVVLGWSFDPERSDLEPIIPVRSDLAQAVGLAGGARRASFHELVTNSRVLDALRLSRAASDREMPLTGIQKEAAKLDARLNWIQGFRDGSLLRCLPASAAGAAWSLPPHVTSLEDLEAFARQGLGNAALSGPAAARELAYNARRPVRIAWGVLALALAASVLGWSLGWKGLDLLAGTGLLAGAGVMTWGLAMRWQIAGRIPASNMYESLLFLGWGAALFALVAAIVFRNRLVILNATAMSALTMLLADRLPIDPFVHPVPPVLSGTPWLAIHVPIIMVSYSVLALGVFVAHMRAGVAMLAPTRDALSSRLNELLYWYIHIGSILLIAGILTGSIWASSSWGRYWGWDPKEVWSLVAFLAYLAILHGRLDRIVGPFGVAVLSILAFWTILMTYIGVNFVLVAGLHSYGFGGSGIVTGFGAVALLEALFLGAAIARHRAVIRAPLVARPA